MRIAYIPADYTGSGFYRIFLPCKYMKQLHETVYLGAGTDLALISILKPDMLIMQRQVMAEKMIPYIRKWNQQGIVTVYELDDDLWHIPLGNKSNYYWSPQNIRGATNIIQECKAVIVSTKPLEKIIASLTKTKVFIVPNFIEECDPLEKDSSIVNIGWGGSASHAMDFSNDIVSALKQIKDTYGNKVQLFFLGMPLPQLQSFANVIPFVPSQEYMRHLQALRLDIGIMPCQMNVFNDSKSNLKFLEYSMLGIASIGSPIYPYTEAVPHGLICIVKNNRFNKWVSQLDRLIKDVDYRKTLAQTARKYVLDNFVISKNVSFIDEIYKKIRMC